ncbi:putative Golgi transport protein Sly1 [Aaosphaeria arxii CBS 175.79]|uniref:Putative Golgi transport protein Sly1 n=1 Tax=Aaosphaeria arxii CBS 175.79 TaxID=1450172 RepID=A0A6A5Y7P2_9PLEO|nr:putative Golgi transport protein Sly1 [Aaosphaeria arxii CBS 175.79]KAF2021027.1 putative Golgi transport protein Sly1 [Aaosphaeria arxii CBS 175.79]
MATALTLRDLQKRSIERILNLNADPKSSSEHNDHHDGSSALSTQTPILTESGEPIWKVLVFDNLGRDVISSVLRVNDLRAWGVTIHLNINTTRHSIPDVPVIYLIEPTAANLEIVTSDLSRGLYSPAHLNFLSSVPRPLLEDFAASTAAAETAPHLASIFDQYLNFIVSEPDLFNLGIDGAYHQLNSAQTSDEELDAMVDRIVSGLFSVAVTMGTIPIIRCPKEGAAEMIAAKLDRKLRDHYLNNKTGLFSGSDQKSAAAVSSRPVLIIVDRNVDLLPMLSHSWTYQSLITDILDMRLNKIKVTVPVDENNPAKGTRKEEYDLQSSDYFWLRNATRPFPDVAEDIDIELKKYEEDASEVTKKTGATSLDDLQGGGIAAHLKGAMALLPELKERKATLSMHMNILKQIVKGIEDRKVHEFFQLEEDITKQTKAQVLETIKSSEKGNEPIDKLRYFIQWYLATEQEISRADMENFTQSLEAAGADTSSLQYVKTVRQLTRMMMISSAPNQPTQPASQLFGGFSSLSSRVTDRFKEAGLGANFDGLVSGIKNLVPKNTDLTLTKITESLMDPQNASSSAISKTESYLYFDPRSANARGTIPPASQARNQQGAVGRGIEASFGQRRQGFSEAILFTVGGGSMDEYGNLQEWAKRTSAAGPKRRVVYGSTALMSATEFVTKDLAALGKETK